MSGNTVFVLFFSGAWGLVGLIFLVVGFALRNSAMRKAERRRARATGTVVSLARHVHHSNRGDSVSWNPVVTFEYEGRPVTLESGDGVSRRKYYEGQSVEVLYDPDDPACFGIDGDGSARLLYRIMMGVGAGCIAVAAIAALVVLNMQSDIQAYIR